MSAAPSPDGHAFDCIMCGRIEMRQNPRHLPKGWRRSDDGVLCDDCAPRAEGRDLGKAIARTEFTGDKASDEQLLAWMSSEAQAMLGLPATATNMFAAGALLGFRFGSPMAASGMALIGEADARLVVREILAQPFAFRAEKALSQ